MSWSEGQIAGFDTETTDSDPVYARIVSASVVIVEAGQAPVHHDWLVAVDEPIPEAATAIHGISTDRSIAEGEPLTKVVTEIHGLLTAVWEDRIPVCAMNLPYDATVLNQERVRCGMKPITYSEVATPVLDPLVIDRALDKYRRGTRNLSALCERYGVTLDAAHASSADALAAVQVMLRMAEVFPQLQRQSLQALYRMQAVWRAQWAQNYQVYLRNKMTAEGADAHEVLNTVIDHQWPVRIPVDAHPDGPMRVGGRQR